MGSFTIDQLLNAIEMSDTAVTMSGHHSSGQEMYWCLRLGPQPYQHGVLASNLKSIFLAENARQYCKYKCCKPR